MTKYVLLKNKLNREIIYNMTTIQQVIAIENPDDPTGVAVMYLTGEMSVEDVLKRDVDTTKPYQVMNYDELPIDEDDFFNAWTFGPKKSDGKYSVMVDMTKAKDITRDKLRIARKSLFEKLDVDFMRAVERGDTTAQRTIADKKQKLRDITQHPDIDSAKCCAELRQFRTLALSQL